MSRMRGTVDDHVYVVEAVFEDGDVSEHWNDEQGERCHIKDVIPKLPWHYLHCVEQEFCCEGVDHALKQEHAEADNCRHSGEQEPAELLATIILPSLSGRARTAQRVLAASVMPSKLKAARNSWVVTHHL